ncbi:MAG: GNAT family N-acetyltransferase [Daejeonella sp.]|uniref:GNAT family N-acetyltransferase n=1 Tax=Daejeonella sp. JGW-45 TaxID=3034148 RepID=UPI0023EDC1B4|nr:GNAT family N-acetyltransferase [Daejeonella sp. JGW-45]
MKTEHLQSADIDRLKELQPETWTDIRPYFYFYKGSDYCQPLKITEDKKIIAVGTSIHHTDSAWLAHIIVHPDHRNKGLGREIASALVKDLDPDRFKTIYLDATDMGYPVYKKLGFEVEAEYIHLSGKHQDLYLSDTTTIIPYHSKYRDELLAMDRSISAEDRVRVLENHLTSSLLCLHEGKLLGAYFPLLLDGFVLALTVEAGTELMKLRMRTKYNARFPANNTACTNFLISNGYEVTGSSKRMILGQKRNWNGEGIFHRISGGLG